MKAVAVLFVFLIAGAVAYSPVQKQRDILEDAMELYTCLLRAIAILEDSINGVLSTVSGLTDIVNKIENMFRDCTSIGGDSPSLIDYIQQGVCIAELGNDIRNLVANSISELQHSVAQVVIAGNNIGNCFD